MARRLPREERPYNPIEAALVQSASGRAEPSEAAAPREEPPPNVIPLQNRPPVAPEAPPSPAAVTPPAKPGREKRVILSWEEELAVNELLEGLSRDLQTPVKLSNMLRACVVLLRHAEGEIRKGGRQGGVLVRPSNSDPAALAYFEHRLARMLQQAIRNSRPLD